MRVRTYRVIAVASLAAFLVLKTLGLAHAHAPHGLASLCTTCHAVGQAYAVRSTTPALAFSPACRAVICAAVKPVHSVSGTLRRSRAPPPALDLAPR